MLMHPLFRTMVWNRDINQPGRLFVISGIDTYSSAFGHVEYFANRSSAVIIGEAPSSKPFHGYGEARLFVLENSGIEIIYSTWYNYDFFQKEADTFHPDIIVRAKASDFFTGGDAVLDYILNGEQN